MGPDAAAHLQGGEDLPVHDHLQVHTSSTRIQSTLTPATSRFLAREIGIAGRNSLEMAQVDEIVDVIQDAVDATVSNK